MQLDTIHIIDKEASLDCDYLRLSFFGEIEMVEFEKLSQFKKLKHLNVSSSDLFDEHLEIIIGQMDSLELLDLDSTEITNNGLRNLKSIKQLRELRLKDNPQLTDECVDFLSDIEQLELIHIDNTSITITGLTKLLALKEMKSVILGCDFDSKIEELMRITEDYPKLEITLKGTGIISNGRLNE